MLAALLACQDEVKGQDIFTNQIPKRSDGEYIILQKQLFRLSRTSTCQQCYFFLGTTIQKDEKHLIQQCLFVAK